MRQRTLTAYEFLTPYLLIFLTFWVWPIMNSFWLSFLRPGAYLGHSARRPIGGV